MHRRRTIIFGALGACLISGLYASVGLGSGSAVVKSTVKVTAGKPSEFRFTLSKSSGIAAGSVTFEVTNKGAVAHDFELCTAPTKVKTKNSCTGKTTKSLKPGQSAKLTVTLKKGTYEYLCNEPGHAALGMKGLLTVGTKAAVTTTTATTTTHTTTTGTTTTTASGPPVFPTGNASNGAGVFASAGCGSCHTLSAAGSTGTVGPDMDHQAYSIPEVENQVYYGGSDMPPFGGANGSLSNQQIADVSTYVSQSSQ